MNSPKAQVIFWIVLLFYLATGSTYLMKKKKKKGIEMKNTFTFQVIINVEFYFFCHICNIF